MKNLILFSALLCLSFTTSQASSILPINKEKGFSLVESSSVDVFVTSAEDLNLFTKVVYQENRKRVVFNAVQNIEFIQLFNIENKMEYQLPVGGNNLRITISDLKKGSYKLNILFEGEEEYVETAFVKK